MSAWVEALRAECARVKSQHKVGQRLGVSASLINQVINGNYKADTRSIEARVRGELMNETVQCPVMGECSKRRCVDVQAQPFAATNPQRVALWRACRSGCPFSSLKEEMWM